MSRPSRVHLGSLLLDALHAGWMRPGRAAALAAAAAVATGLVVASLGLAQTAAAQVSDRFDIRRNREIALVAAAVPEDAERRVSAVAGVESVGVMAFLDQEYVGRSALGEPRPAAFLAVSPGWFDAVCAEVRWLPGVAPTLGPREVVVGVRTFEALELASLADGPTVSIGGLTFAVKGVVDEVERVPEALAGVLMSTADAADIATQASESTVLIRTASGAAPQVARLAPIALDPADPDRFDVNAPPDPSTLRAEIESDVVASLLVMTAIAFIAAVVGIANAMTMNVIERLGEFGLRRAIGARATHVLAQVTIESTSIGLAGGVAGLYCGVAGLLGVTVAKRWQPVLDLRLIPLALASGAVAGILGGLAAGIRAVRILPSDALRR